MLCASQKKKFAFLPLGIPDNWRIELFISKFFVFLPSFTKLFEFVENGMNLELINSLLFIFEIQIIWKTLIDC